MLENFTQSQELELVSLRREYQFNEHTIIESSELNDCFTSVQTAFMCNDDEDEATTSTSNKFEHEVDKEKHIEEQTKASLTETTTILELSNCDECEFVGTVKNDLRDHMKLRHEAQCETCKEMFVGMHKVENHMCRIF